MEMHTALLENCYLSLDELDPEAREDVEVALYGMLHHSSVKEDQPPDFPSAQESSEKFLNNEVKTINFNHAVQKENSINTGSLATEDLKGKDTVLHPAVLKNEQKTVKKTKTISPKKPVSPRKIGAKVQQVIKRSPYSQYLIIERSKRSSLLKKKGTKKCEVITLSDDEDSKYASISKATKKKQERILHSQSNAYYIAAPDTSSSEESETDNSVVILDGTPKRQSQTSAKVNTDSSLVIDLNASSERDSSSESVTSSHSLANSATDLDQSSSDRTDLDSDIEIITEKNNPNFGVDLKLNISQTEENVSVACVNSSDSSRTHHLPNWEQYCSTKWTKEMIRFYDKEGEDVDLQAIMNSIPKKVHWYVGREDRMSDYSGRNRYFGKRLQMKCANCSQWDHLTKHCKEPVKVIVCKLCGKPGHNNFACPSKICLGCGRPNKILVECCPECNRERNIVCMICRSKHITERCPDLWRRYHLTTSESGGIVNTGSSLKPDHLLFCCYCAGRGHAIHDCPERRYLKFLPVNTAVFSYENPKAFLDSVTNNGTSVVAQSNGGKELWVVAASQEKPIKGTGTKTWFVPKKSYNEHAMDIAKTTVLREVKNVDISWKMQKKRKRVCVEFTGDGDTLRAKISFKKVYTFTKKPVASDSLPSSSGKSGRKDTTFQFAVTAIKISHTTSEGRQKRTTITMNLLLKEKKAVKVLLKRLTKRHNVDIAENLSGSTWEITIHKLNDGSTSSPWIAFHSLMRFLDLYSMPPENV